jgi:ubiquitin-protein ligase
MCFDNSDALAGIFKLSLSFSPDFPSTPPKGTFVTKIFHPNVSVPSGEICVSTLKRDWSPDLGIEHILLVSELVEAICIRQRSANPPQIFRRPSNHFFSNRILNLH